MSFFARLLFGVTTVFVFTSTRTPAQSIYEPYSFSTLAGLAGKDGSADGLGSEARFNGPSGEAVDSAGNVYVADTRSHTIRKLAPSGMVTTLAGMAGTYGSADGTGADARFFVPRGLAADSADNVYVADSGNNVIRKITPAGVVTTLAGLTEFESGFPLGGSTDGTGRDARFNNPSGVAVDNAGNVYVADAYNYTIRKVTPAGVVTTLAGLARYSGIVDGVGNDARFYYPAGVAVDSAGTLYVGDAYAIRKVTRDGVVTTLAGLFGSYGSTDGIGSAARFAAPYPSLDSAGNIYVADAGNSSIRKVTPTGRVATLAGLAGKQDSTDGIGSDARFNSPFGIALDSVGNLYVADSQNQTIRKGIPVPGPPVISIGPQSQLVEETYNVSFSVVVSQGSRLTYQWLKDGVEIAGANDNIYSINYVRLNDAGTYNVVVSNPDGSATKSAVLTVTPAYTFTTLAGIPGPLTPSTIGSADGTGSAARFAGPWGVALDKAGNVFVADTGHNTIRKVTPAGLVTTLAGLPAYDVNNNYVRNSSGSADGTGSEARFNSPSGVAVDNAGNVYVTDTQNNTVRKLEPSGVVTTLSGTAGTFGSVDGTGNDARFNVPRGLAADSAGNLYLADSANNTIRKITPTGVVTTLAGMLEFDDRGIPQGGSADGTGREARFNDPWGVAVDNAGNVYVADTDNQTIRKVTPEGVVTTLAGLAGSSGSTDGIGSDARFYEPGGLAVDGSGNVYVGDLWNSTVRRITPAGAVTTLAGMAGKFGFSGNLDGTGSDVRFAGGFGGGLFPFPILGPVGLAVDNAGNLYVTDQGNNTIRKGFVRPTFLTRNLAVTDGKFSADFTGLTGQSVVIESSDDLKNWLPVWTGTSTGVLHFTDPKSATASNSFYRARLP